MALTSTDFQAELDRLFVEAGFQPSEDRVAAVSMRGGGEHPVDGELAAAPGAAADQWGSRSIR